jgi:beta-glucanase (GH16 family)
MIRPAVEPLEARMLLSTVVGRYVFYNRSAFDGRGARADVRDDAAVAPDKAALLPGQSPAPANYTSYTRGINGIMIDVAGLPAGATLTAADFEFRTGNNGQPTSWKPALPPRSVTQRVVPDAPDITRITLTWRDRAIRNAWLRVTVNANAAAEFAAPDVFYFGNLVGETGDDASGRVARVSDDEIAQTGSNFARDVPITHSYDVDRNGKVASADVRALRRNLDAELYTTGPFSSAGTATIDAPVPGNWQLIFRDEFSENFLNPVWHPAQYWNHDLTVVGNGELQAYDPSGVSLSGGQLHLTAREDDARGVPYTSGLVMTGGEKFIPASPRFSFLYGYVEVRARIPAGAGLWPAVWMMPASYHDDAGELDVVEFLGDAPNHAQFTAHRGRRQDSHGWDGPDLSQDFHTYGIEWQADHVAWFVDGVERARTDRPNVIVDEAMYPILNLAVGGDFAGPPDASTPFPATMEVDYVRVWQSA